MKVLIADDSSVMRRLLSASLQEWEFDVVEAKHGAEAWQLFQQGDFPLVLTDWMMPEMDGLELIRRIRGLDLPSYVYIILLTARSEKQDLVEAMEAGADDFVAKPIDQGELRVRLREGERIIRLERTLADQNRRLRDTQAALVQSEKLASLGQLAAGMAHEINNPAAFVTNNLAVLQRDVAALIELVEKYGTAREAIASANAPLAEEIAHLEEQCDWNWLRENVPQMLTASQTGLLRIRKIVSSLRDFARLDEAESDELDVSAALQSTLNVLLHEIESKQLQVATQFTEVPPILCHPAKIHQVLYALLLNAIQASATGQRIQLRTLPAEGGVQIEIEDEGCGIEPANLPHLFEPFFTTKPVGGGVGLGLAISYGIVRDHGGRIEVVSQPGQGSTFRVWLPRQSPAVRPAATG